MTGIRIRCADYNKGSGKSKRSCTNNQQHINTASEGKKQTAPALPKETDLYDDYQKGADNVLVNTMASDNNISLSNPVRKTLKGQPIPIIRASRKQDDAIRDEATKDTKESSYQSIKNAENRL